MRSMVYGLWSMAPGTAGLAVSRAGACEYRTETGPLSFPLQKAAWKPAPRRGQLAADGVLAQRSKIPDSP